MATQMGGLVLKLTASFFAFCRRRLNRRPDAPLGHKIFLDLGQGMGVTDELLGGGEAMH